MSLDSSVELISSEERLGFMLNVPEDQVAVLGGCDDMFVVGHPF